MPKTLLPLVFMFIFLVGFVEFSTGQDTIQEISITRQLLRKTKGFNKSTLKYKEHFLEKLKQNEKQFQRKLCASEEKLADRIFILDIDAAVQVRRKTTKPQERFQILDTVAIWASGNIPLEKELDKVKTFLDEADILQQFLRIRKKQLGEISLSRKKTKRIYDRYSRNVYYLKAGIEERKKLYKQDVMHILLTGENAQKTLAKKMKYPMKKMDTSLPDTDSILKLPGEENLSTLDFLNNEKNFANDSVGLELPNLQNSIANDMELDDPTKNLNVASLKPNFNIDAKTFSKAEVESMINSTVKSLGPDAKSIVADNMAKMHKQIGKLKYDYPNINNVADAPASKINPYRPKPFRGRLEKGWNVQLNQNVFWKATGINAAYEVGYKHSPKLTTGIGLSYSIGWMNKLSKVFDNGFSPRIYLDYKLSKIVYLTITSESIVPIHIISENKNANSTDLNAAVLAGIKIKFNSSRRKNPEMQLLYQVSSRSSENNFTYRIGYKR